MQAGPERRRERQRGAELLNAEPRILLPRGVRYGGRPAGLLTRGSPVAAFPARRPVAWWRRASPLTAAGPSRTLTGFPHRAPVSALNLPWLLHGLSLVAGARLGGRDLRVLLHPVAELGAGDVGHRPAQARAHDRVRGPRRPARPRDRLLRPGLRARGRLRRDRPRTPPVRAPAPRLAGRRRDRRRRRAGRAGRPAI